MAEVETHQRVHDMLFGPLERPALRWLASRMPGWMNPDILTGIGIAGAFAVFAGYSLTRMDDGFLWLASLGFAINWFGDSLDGTLARFRKIERPKYGFFLDHTVDAFSMVVIFIGLGLSPHVRLDLAAIGAAGYLMMSVLSLTGAFVSGQFQISYAKIGPTEMRLIAVVANTLVFFFGNPVLRSRFPRATAFDVLVMAIDAALFIMFLSMNASEIRKWNELDPPPRGQDGGSRRF